MTSKRELEQNTINPTKIHFSQDAISSKFYGGEGEIAANKNQKPNIFMNGDTLWLRELFPKAKLEIYKAEMEKLIRFSKENFNGVGWKNIKTLPNLGNVYDCKISLPALRSSVFSKWTDYGSFDTDDVLGQEFTVKDSFVFAYNDKLFVYGISMDDVIVELCVDYTFLDIQLIEVMSTVLYGLGVKYNLMLADWRSKDIVDMSNKKDVIKYLHKLKEILC